MLRCDACVGGRWQCTVKGGREGRDIDAVELAKAVQELGAGEILLNCIDRDGRCASSNSFFVSIFLFFDHAEICEAPHTNRGAVRFKSV